MIVMVGCLIIVVLLLLEVFYNIGKEDLYNDMEDWFLLMERLEDIFSLNK